MKIFESGDSIVDKIQGYQVKCRTFVCVEENSSEEPIGESFANMEKYLQNDLSLKIVERDVVNFKVSCDSGDTYTLAHDRTFGGDKKLICKKSNLLRHIITRPFIVNGLYEDDRGEIIDLTTRAKRDAANKMLYLANDMKLEFDNNPDIIVNVLDYIISKNYNIGGQLENCFHKGLWQKPISNPNILLNNLFEFNSKLTIDTISSFRGLRDYFYKYCNLTLHPKLNIKEYDEPKKVKTEPNINDVGNVIYGYRIVLGDNGGWEHAVEPPIAGNGLRDIPDPMENDEIQPPNLDEALIYNRREHRIQPAGIGRRPIPQPIPEPVHELDVADTNPDMFLQGLINAGRFIPEQAFRAAQDITNLQSSLHILNMQMIRNPAEGELNYLQREAMIFIERQEIISQLVDKFEILRNA